MFRTFNDSDWQGYQGCEPFTDGTHPLIASHIKVADLCPDCDVICDKNAITISYYKDDISFEATRKFAGFEPDGYKQHLFQAFISQPLNLVSIKDWGFVSEWPTPDAEEKEYLVTLRVMVPMILRISVTAPDGSSPSDRAKLMVSDNDPHVQDRMYDNLKDMTENYKDVVCEQIEVVEVEDN